MSFERDKKEVWPIVQLIYNLGIGAIGWVSETIIVEMLRAHGLPLGQKPLMGIKAHLHELVEVNWLLERRVEEEYEYRAGLRAFNQIGKANMDKGRAQFMAAPAKPVDIGNRQDDPLVDFDWGVQVIGKPTLTATNFGCLMAMLTLACKIVPPPAESRQRKTLVTLVEAVKELCQGNQGATTT